MRNVDRVSSSMRVVSRKRQRGSLMVEIGVAIIIITILTQINASKMVTSWNERRAESTGQEVFLLSEAALDYYDANGAWPDEAGGCVNAFAVMQGAGFLPAGMDRFSPFYNPASNPDGDYDFTCTPQLFTISVDAKPGWGVNLLSMLGGATIAGNTVSQSVPVPGSFAGLNALLPRDGSRPMTGSLDMGGQDINNANQVTTTNLFWGPTGASELKTDQGGALELGDSTNAGGESPYIDFHFGRGAAQDYNVRIVNDADGRLTLDAATVRATGDLAAQDVTSNIKGRSLAQSVQDATIVASGSLISKPTCPGGQTPQVFLAPATFSPNNLGTPIGAVQTWAVDSGANWQANMRIMTTSGWVVPTATYGKILAMTKCT